VLNGIATVAGNGFASDDVDSVGLATQVALSSPRGVFLDSDGTYVYIAEQGAHCVRRFSTVTNIISVFAGTCLTSGFSGNGGAATSATLDDPVGIAEDPSGSVYIADKDNNQIRKVDGNGIITAFGGTGSADSSGDGGQATSAGMYSAVSLFINSAGEMYFGSYNVYSVRKIGSDGIVTVFAGNYHIVVVVVVAVVVVVFL
jgi:streptogramin lyase